MNKEWILRDVAVSHRIIVPSLRHINLQGIAPFPDFRHSSIHWRRQTIRCGEWTRRGTKAQDDNSMTRKDDALKQQDNALSDGTINRNDEAIRQCGNTIFISRNVSSLWRIVSLYHFLILNRPFGHLGLF
jgi:hypothetical protein